MSKDFLTFLKNPPPGIKSYRTANGSVMAEIHYSADPAKDQVWAATAKARSKDERTWRREMELDGSVYAGQAVYQGFDPDLHTSLTGWFQYKQENFQEVCVRGIIPGSYHFLGFDFGRTPACVFTQVLPPPSLQVQTYRVEQAFNMTTSAFAPWIHHLITRVYKLTGSIICFGDPQGSYGNEIVETSSYEIFAALGIHIQPGVTDQFTRGNAVNWLLQDRIDENHMRYSVDKSKCGILVDGFMGGYKLKEIKGPGGEIKFHEKPDKTVHSHSMEGFEYTAPGIVNLIRMLHQPRQNMGAIPDLKQGAANI